MDKKLNQKIGYLEMQPINKKLSYSTNMRDYYTKLTSSEDESENLLGRMSKIIAGQYHGSLDEIKKGNYNENTFKTRIWKWEDRLNALTEIYKNKKGLVSQLDEGLKQRLKEILRQNRYLRRKHPDKLKEIAKLFS